MDRRARTGPAGFGGPLAVSAIAFFLAVAGAAVAAPAPAKELQQIRMAFIKQELERLPKLSNLEPLPKDDGVLGGEQGLEDVNITGRFLGHSYVLERAILDLEGDAPAAFKQFYDQGIRIFVLDVSLADLLKIADSEQGAQALLFNVGLGDNSLRTKDCRASVIHVAPSYAMRADALAQYLIAKKWDQWFLVVGRRESDRQFAEAMRNSAKKFRGKIVADKNWDFGPDMRRTAASTVPVFTQDVDYDALIVADVVGEFGEYLMYRTWKPRLVAGTQGLWPVIWHRAHEQWGAAQIQKRFRLKFNKSMSEKDYSVWASVRSVATAVARGKSAEYEALRAYLTGPKFELAGYKGQKLSLRRWNQQLRQPILLVSPTSLVAVSPQRQFLHEATALDTLGYDRRETQCALDEQ